MDYKTWATMINKQCVAFFLELFSNTNTFYLIF